MMMSTEKRWSRSFGSYGRTIRVAEREPGGILYLHWFDKSGKLRKRSLGHRDRERGEREAAYLSGRLAREVEVLSLPSGTTLPHSISVGEIAGPVAPASMVGGKAIDRVVMQAEAISPAELVKRPLTIVEGIEKAFDSESGRFATETRHKVEARSAVDRLAAQLPPDMVWEELKPAVVTTLIRRAARASDEGAGFRAAEFVWEMMYSIAQWLRDEEMIPRTAAVPRSNWKAKLREEWESVTEVMIEVNRPRFTKVEFARLLAKAHKVRPQLKLLLEVGAELRGGQVRRCRRSDLELKGGGFGLGRLHVRGRGRKKGEIVDLHPELRALIDYILTEGYLRDAEAAFRTGEISDYYLFPAGRLRQGRARVDLAATKHVNRRTLNDWFRELERAAGVEHKPGRAFYGLRRYATDLAPEFETDDRVLNRLTGHIDTKTRTTIYQDQQDDEMRARAARARRAMRNHLSEVAQEA